MKKKYKKNVFSHIIQYNNFPYDEKSQPNKIILEIFY